MKDQIKELIEDYKRKIRLISTIDTDLMTERLKIKRGCFNAFVTELERILKSEK